MVEFYLYGIMEGKEGFTMRKAIFGGTFDPIHVGHLHIAYEALYNLNLDKVIFMPSGNPPHKMDRVVTAAELRYKMVEVAIQKEPLFELSDYEINNSSVSYTYKTMEHFDYLEPETEWYFLVGVDSLMDLKKWKNVHIILQHSKLAVFSRPGYANEDIIEMKKFIEETYKQEIIYLEMPILDISSTVIKKKMNLNRQVDYLLPCGVQEIINNYHIYK